MVLDNDTARAAFESSTDFTVGLEEEFAILDEGLALTPGFEAMRDAARADPVLSERLKALDVTPEYGGAPVLRARLLKDIKNWGAFIEAKGLKAQ